MADLTTAAAALEHPACPLCGTGRAVTVFDEVRDDWVPDGESRALRFTVVRCVSCGGQYTTPRFCEAQKQLAFAGSYPFYLRARRDASFSKTEIKAFDRRVKLVERALPGPGSVLDLGMGDGAFLAAMQQRGWRITGIDSEPDVVDYARRRLGLASCTIADAEREPLPAGPFDLVTMWGMLQLSYHPRQLLEKVRGILVEEGLIAIGVSNIGSAGARLFGRHWRGLGLPRHLVHFDRASLCQLVERAGYRPLVWAFETPYWMTAPSVSASLQLGGIPEKIARRLAHAILALPGRTPLGDTMMLIARARRD